MAPEVELNWFQLRCRAWLRTATPRTAQHPPGCQQRLAPHGLVEEHVAHADHAALPAALLQRQAQLGCQPARAATATGTAAAAAAPQHQAVGLKAGCRAAGQLHRRCGCADGGQRLAAVPQPGWHSAAAAAAAAAACASGQATSAAHSPPQLQLLGQQRQAGRRHSAPVVLHPEAQGGQVQLHVDLTSPCIQAVAHTLGQGLGQRADHVLRPHAGLQVQWQAPNGAWHSLHGRREPVIDGHAALSHPGRPNLGLNPRPVTTCWRMHAAPALVNAVCPHCLRSSHSRRPTVAMGSTTEKDVGITLYANSCAGFSAILKHRCTRC